MEVCVELQSCAGKRVLRSMSVFYDKEEKP